MLWPFQPATGMGGDQYLRYLQIRLVLPDFVVRLSTLAGTQSQAQTKYGPEAGWTAVSCHPNSNGTAQMLWNHTDGTASVWTLDVRGDVTSRMLYGPYTDEPGTLTWIAADYRRNSDGTANMLWVRTDAYTRCSSFFIQAAAGIISPIEPMFARRFNEGVGS